MLIETRKQSQNQENINRVNQNEQTRAINTGISGHLGQQLPVTLFICLLITKTFRKKLSSFLKTVICHSRTKWISMLSQIWGGIKEHRTSPFRPAGFTALISPINILFSPNKNTDFLTFNPILHDSYWKEKFRIGLEVLERPWPRIHHPWHAHDWINIVPNLMSSQQNWEARHAQWP